jgi:hypothetical protein
MCAKDDMFEEDVDWVERTFRFMVLQPNIFRRLF